MKAFGYIIGYIIGITVGYFIGFSHGEKHREREIMQTITTTCAQKDVNEWLRLRNGGISWSMNCNAVRTMFRDMEKPL